MGNKKIYVHYGHKHFDKELFKEIKNINNFVKPNGGLWASDIDAEYGWKDFVDNNNFNTEKYQDFFRFLLKDNAKVLTITNSKQLKDLPKNKNTIYQFEAPFVMLDFEELKKHYDAIEVLISAEDSYDDIGMARGLYWDLYGWDCDTLLVMNKDVVEEI